jgi:hypothetical protein
MFHGIRSRSEQIHLTAMLDGLLCALWLRAEHTRFVQQHMAQQILAQFQEHPEAWQRVPVILESSSNSQAKVS